MAKKKEAVLIDESEVSNLGQVAEEARRLTDRARQLADVSGSNLVSVGMVCIEFRKRPDLYISLGYRTFDAWREDVFGKKAGTARSSQKIVESLQPYFTEVAILEMGRVKANAYSKLPESERDKDHWRKHVEEDDASTFAERVKRFLNGDDLREGFCKIVVDAPKSFRDTTFARVIEKGKAAEGTGEPFMILEAALVNLEQSWPDGLDGAKVNAIIPATRESRSLLYRLLEQANSMSGRESDVTMVAALNLFVGAEA